MLNTAANMFGGRDVRSRFAGYLALADFRENGGQEGTAPTTSGPRTATEAHFGDPPRVFNADKIFQLSPRDMKTQTDVVIPFHTLLLP